MVKPAWLNGHLEISATALREVERCGREAYARNEEACGYLSGPADSPLAVDTAVEMENLANKYHKVDPESHPRTGREYFKINTLKFERSLAQAQADSQPAKVFFHSHLDCGAYFSEEDAASMTAGGTQDPAYDLCYLVTAVDQGEVTAHKLFAWAPASKSFVEVPFSVV